MKVSSIQRDITLKAGSYGHPYESQKEKGMGLCKKERGNNAEFCGSFTGKSEAATSFLDKILKSNWFGKFAKYSHDHNISTSALIALVLAGIMRPATIMALPGKKDKEDKIYASGHAMASGILGFVVSTAITSPFDESIHKVFDPKKGFAKGKFKDMMEKIKNLEAQKEANTITTEAKAELKNLLKKRDALNTLVKNIPDWIIGVPRAILTIALIPPILKYVFGVEKKKKSAQPIQETKSQDFIEKPIFSAFKGGVK